MKLRYAKKEDTNYILNLLYEMGRPKPQNDYEKKIFIKRLLDYQNDKNKKIIIAEINDQIVGCLCYIIISKINRVKPELYITELVVTEKMRRNGIGKSLIQKCIKHARKTCFRIRLESGIEREIAHLFYKNLNFEQSALTYTMVFDS